MRLAEIVSGGDLDPIRSYWTTITTRPGTYAVLDTTDGRVSGRPQVFVASAPRSAARPPERDATVVLRDYRFQMPATLPAGGTVRFRNAGDRLHFAIALKLARGVPVGRVLADLRRGRERAADVAVRQTAVSLVSPDTTNDVALRLAPGRYVLVCYHADAESGGTPHNRLGMQSAFAVR